MNEDFQYHTKQTVDWWTLAFWGIVALAFFLRFYDLASMPLHHDESLYGVYCWRFFTGQGYQYDPMMHGPFMFHFQLIIFFLMGVSDFTVRVAPALFGTLLIAGTWYLKEYIGKAGIVLVALLLTLSPTHLYFSRFMRHDSYMAFFTYTSVVFALCYYRTRHKSHLYLLAASVAFMFCVKENSYIHTFIFVTFLLLKETVGYVLRRRPQFQGLLEGQFSVYLRERFPDEYRDQPFIRLWLFLRAQRDPLIFAGFIFLWIYLLLYSTFFTNPGGFLDGVYRKSLTYWWNQHDIQRIKGPFLYYIPFFFLYELPVMVIVLGTAFSTLVRLLFRLERSLNATIMMLWLIIFPACLIVLFGHHLLPEWCAWLTAAGVNNMATLVLGLSILGCVVWGIVHTIGHWQQFTLKHLLAYWGMRGFLLYTLVSVYLVSQYSFYQLPQKYFGFTHMETLPDLVVSLYILCIGLWGTLYSIAVKKPLLAFFIYWSAIGFLIYAYAGEKVPWLFLHIMLPLLILAGLCLRQLLEAEIWQRSHISTRLLRAAAIGIGSLFIAFTLHTTLLLNYHNRANPAERMVYTQTSNDMLHMLDTIRRIQFEIGAEAAQQPTIGVQGNAVWPLAWYLRDDEGWYHPGDMTDIQRPMAVIDWDKREDYHDTFAENYREIRVKLREWWIPGQDGSLKDWWYYFLYRHVYNPTGSSDVAFYVRRFDT